MTMPQGTILPYHQPTCIAMTRTCIKRALSSNLHHRPYLPLRPPTMGCFGSKPVTTTATPNCPPSYGLSQPYPDLTQYISKTPQKAPKYGGFSDVYEGTLTLPGQAPRTVAIKILRGIDVGAQEVDIPQTKERLEKRLQREMRVWRPLEHPRIVPCLGFGTVDRQPCLVSPWCKNGNAQEYIAKHPNCDRKALVAQVAEGLIFLHNRQPPVVHHDVKSLNVLIGDTGEAMLTDFGIAKVMDDIRAGFTTTHATAYTARCAAPEALDGGERTTLSDVFSFACVALEIVSGKPPWHYAKNPAGIMMARAVERVPNPAKSVRLPPTDPLWDILNKCWAQDPNSRPSMKEVLRDLHALGYRA